MIRILRLSILSVTLTANKAKLEFLLAPQHPRKPVSVRAIPRPIRVYDRESVSPAAIG